MIATASDRAERLKNLREDSGHSLEFVGKRVGKSHETVRRYENDSNTKIKPEILAKLASLYKTSVEYIKTGKHPKPSEKLDVDFYNDIEQSNARRIHMDDVTVRNVKFLPIKARATFAETFADDSYKFEREEYMPVVNVPDTKEFADPLLVEIDGDSMEPTLKYGAIYMTTPVPQGEWEYMNPDIYCIVYRTSFVVKRVKDNTLLRNGLLTLHSDNEKGGSFDVRGEDIRAVWRLRWGVYVPVS